MRKNVLKNISYMSKRFGNYITNLPIQIKRILFELVILIILLSILIPITIYHAEKQKLVIYTGNNLNEKKYPEYKELIDDLQRKHPNWQFTLFYTKLNWEEVIKEEGHSDKRSRPLNLIPQSFKYPEDWKCSIDKDKTFDNGSWYCASDKAIRYQMDPRNLLNDKDIFQLKEITFLNSACTVEGIMKKTENSFLEGETVADALIEAGKKANIDPYFIVSRLIQEQGRKGTKLSRGYTYQDKTVYNPFNIAASS